VGWKLGYTSAAMRAQMGIDAPNLGPLTDVMLLADAEVPPAALQPRVEPEIALRLTRPVGPGVGVDDVLEACSGPGGGAVTCLEVVDSVWAGYRFRLEDNTADGSSAGWVVLGDPLPLDDLSAVEVDLLVDGVEVERATGAAAGGHPARGVAWLAAEVHRRYGRDLAVGEVIITGGLTSAHPLPAGGRVTGRFTAGTVRTAVTVTRRRPRS
jgi:2-keto-4-pentenoate hydratase